LLSSLLFRVLLARDSKARERREDSKTWERREQTNVIEEKYDKILD
jgi:hypothetical protein